MKWFVPVLIALLSHAGQQAHADCTHGEEIDLRKTKAAIFEDLPIRNQGTYGICYAHAASTLIDFHRISRNGGKSVNLSDPLASAIISTKVMEEMSIDGGYVCDVVDGLKKTGFGCSNSGATANQVRDLGNSMQRFLVEQVFMPYLSGQKKFKPILGSWIDPSVRKTVEKKLSSEQKTYLDRMTSAVYAFENLISNRGIPRDRFPKTAKLVEFFQNTYINSKWASFEADLAFMVIRNNCIASKFTMPALTCQEHKKGNSDVINVMDTSLKSGRPIGATICANFLTQKNYYGATSGSSVNRDCLSHAVVIIGKRDRAGSCEYLIRNSWGANYSYAWPSSNGDVWVNQYSLLGNLSQVQTVK
jgi:hypothetical protein